VGRRDFVVRSSSSEASVETSSAVESSDDDELDSRDVSSGAFIGVSLGGGDGVRCAT